MEILTLYFNFTCEPINGLRTLCCYFVIATEIARGTTSFALSTYLNEGSTNEKKKTRQ